MEFLVKGGLDFGCLFKSLKVWMQSEDRESKGGRLTLIKSTLSTLLIYFISRFIILKVVFARLEKMLRDFLGGGALEKGLIW